MISRLLSILVLAAVAKAATANLVYDTVARVAQPTNLIFRSQHITNSTIDGVASSAIATNNAANKLNITNGTPVVAGVSIGTNAMAQIASPYVSGGTLITAGDSWTAGIGAYVSTPITNYYSSAQTLATGNRYANILASRTGMTLNNVSEAGTGMRFNPGTFLGTNGVFGRVGGTLGVSWAGTLTLLPGYNDGFAQYGGTNFTQVWRQAYRALVARGLIDYGVAPTGRDTSFASYTWTTDGTNATDVVSSANNPFRTVSSSDTNRVGTVISGSQRIAVSLTNWPNAVIFFDQSTDGGQAIVATNGLQAGTIQSYAPMSTFGSLSLATDRIPGAIVLRNLSGTTALTITNQTGSLRVLAIGRLPTGAPGRNIVLGSPGQTLSLNRSAGVLGNLGRLARAVAGEFRDWPVFFADVGNALNVPEHIVHPTLDPDHPNPWGNAAIANAFVQATKVNADSSVNATEARFTTLTAEGTLAIDGPSDAIKELDFYSAGVMRSRIALAPANDLYFQAYNSSGAFIRNLGIMFAAGGTFLDGALTNNGEYVNVGGGVTATGTGSFGGFVTANNDDSGNGVVLIRGTTNDYRVVDFYSGGASLRWRFGIQPGVESSTAVGSDLVIEAANNSGIAMTPPWRLTRLGAQTILGAGSFGGQITTTNASNNGIVIGGGQNLLRYLDFTTGTTNRWRLFVNSDTESGANAGATLILNAFADDGTFLASPISFNRSDAATTIRQLSVLLTSSFTGDVRANTLNVTNGINVGGLPVVTKPTTETLTYSTTNVTITAGKGPMQRSRLTVTNNFQLLWSGLADNDGGVVHLIPATTNVTVLVSSPGRAAGSSAATATGSTTLTITGTTNGWAELAWSVVSVGGTNRVSVNLGAY